MECRLPDATGPGVDVLSADQQTAWRWPLVPVMSRLHDGHFHMFVCVAATAILVWWHFDTEFCFVFLLKSKRTNYGGASI